MHQRPIMQSVSHKVWPRQRAQAAQASLQLQLLLCEATGQDHASVQQNVVQGLSRLQELAKDVQRSRQCRAAQETALLSREAE